MITDNGRCVIDHCEAESSDSWQFLQIGRINEGDKAWQFTVSFGVCATHKAFLEETFNTGVYLQRVDE
jgi:hypothetical protein